MERKLFFTRWRGQQVTVVNEDLGLPMLHVHGHAGPHASWLRGRYHRAVTEARLYGPQHDVAFVYR